MQSGTKHAYIITKKVKIKNRRHQADTMLHHGAYLVSYRKNKNQTKQNKKNEYKINEQGKHTYTSFSSRKLSYSGAKEDCYVCVYCVIKNDNSIESIVTFYHVFAVDIIIYLFI